MLLFIAIDNKKTPLLMSLRRTERELLVRQRISAAFPVRKPTNLAFFLLSENFKPLKEEL